MPRFYVDIRNGEYSYRDDEGVELADLEAAREEALVVLPQIASSHETKSNLEITATIRDEHDRPIFRATLAVTSEWLTGTPPKAKKP